MSKHTPGPWKSDETEVECRIGIITNVSRPGHPGEECLVAEVCCFDGFPPGENGVANARLIAAAPDLLLALKELSALCSWKFDGYEKDSREAKLLDLADAAIEKAIKQ